MFTRFIYTYISHGVQYTYIRCWTPGLIVCPCVLPQPRGPGCHCKDGWRHGRRDLKQQLTWHGRTLGSSVLPEWVYREEGQLFYLDITEEMIAAFRCLHCCQNWKKEHFNPFKSKSVHGGWEVLSQLPHLIIETMVPKMKALIKKHPVKIGTVM